MTVSRQCAVSFRLRLAGQPLGRVPFWECQFFLCRLGYCQEAGPCLSLAVPVPGTGGEYEVVHWQHNQRLLCQW